MWKLGHTPIQLNELYNALQDYPKHDIAELLKNGFTYGFKINYTGPRMSFETKNLKSVLQNPDAAIKKVENEIVLGRIAGPFESRPISNLRCSPIGLVPKKTSGWRLITHLSYPPSNSVNDFIDENLTSVQYSSFDNAVSIVQKLGKNAKIGKMDIKSAFRLLPVYPGDFDLLGFKIGNKYYIDKCMPMGCSISCATFEHFSTFLHWLVKEKHGSKNLDHYLDDFFFAGKNDTECLSLMSEFKNMCKQLGVPIADEKTEGPVTLMEYLGLSIDTETLTVKIPKEKINELLSKINQAAFSKKITLKQLQSLCGSLAFCSRALPSGRAFSRRLYLATAKAKKPHHFIRITKDVYEDLMMWKLFIENFNGTSYILDDWISNFDLKLYTDSAGGASRGCGAYCQNKWVYLQWPLEWVNSEILKDITFLEIIPIALAIFLWYKLFHKKRIIFYIDNLAVVSILNSKTSKSARVMVLLRFIVYWSLVGNLNFKAVHISSSKNVLADCLSRGKFQKFRELLPSADPVPTTVPLEFWNLLKKSSAV